MSVRVRVKGVVFDLGYLHLVELRVAGKGEQRRTRRLVETAEHGARAPSDPRGALGARRRGLQEGPCRC